MRNIVLTIIACICVLFTRGAAIAVIQSEWTDGKMHPVESTVFDAAKYDGGTQTLTLLFRSGDVYQYFGVSRKTFHTFMLTEHKGSFFNAHIRRDYKYRFAGTAP